jgi:predicted aspartyl protease
MSTIFIIAEAGDPQLWLVDTAARTVEPVAEDTLDADFMNDLRVMRAKGGEITRNVDVAIAVSASSEVTARVLSTPGDLPR